MSCFAKAQVWAPSGATWHYDWAQMWSSGYVKIQYTNDSAVGGKVCKVLKKELHSYDWINHIYQTSVLGYEYTYFEDNIVYYYRFGKFFRLYDFNANAGSSWEVAGWEQNNPCDSTGTIVSNSTGMTTINSIPLKYLAVSPGNSSEWSLGDSILERIGSLGYMFPEPTCFADLFEGGPLRCYYDDTFGLYERGYASSCDYITGTDKIPSVSDQIKIYPNPTSSTLTLEINRPVKDKLFIEIFDFPGHKMKEVETDEMNLVIDVKDLSEGVYFIVATDATGFIWSRKIIKTMHEYYP